MTRIGKVERTTKESSILVQLDLDGTGQVEISTGVPFYDHMLTAFGVHGSLDLKVEATAIVRGQARPQALGDKSGIRRFGDSWIPMDETLAHAAIDVSGRPFCVHVGEPEQFNSFTIGRSEERRV